MHLEKEIIELIYKNIKEDRDCDSCPDCPFHGSDCVNNIKDLLRSNRLSVDFSVQKYPSPRYAYFNCNKAFVALYNKIHNIRGMVKI